MKYKTDTIEQKNIPLDKNDAVKHENFMASAAAFILGIFMIIAVGFAPMEVVHNAAHDTRHAISFPCH